MKTQTLIGTSPVGAWNNINAEKLGVLYKAITTATASMECCRLGFIDVPSYNYDIDDVTIAELDEIREEVENLRDLFYRDVVVKCTSCGQWSAAYTACKHCGHPVDPEKELV